MQGNYVEDENLPRNFDTWGGEAVNGRNASACAGGPRCSAGLSLEFGAAAQPALDAFSRTAAGVLQNVCVFSAEVSGEPGGRC